MNERTFVEVDGKPEAVTITPAIRALIDKKLSEVIKKKAASSSSTLWFNGAAAISAILTYVLNQELLTDPFVTTVMITALAVSNKILRVFKTDSAVELK